jgi:hypothetical protein
VVTQQEIDEAEAAVETAEAKLDTAEQYHHQAGGEKAVAELKAARFDAYGARDRVRLLKSRWAAEQAAGRARTAAEEAFGERERKAMARRLEEARDEALAAVVEAQRAAGRVLESVGAYEAAVRQSAAELKARGLSADGGHAWGGTAGGVARVGGETFRPADAGALLGEVMRAAVAERDQRHPLGQMKWGQLGGLAESQARAELLSRAAER